MLGLLSILFILLKIPANKGYGSVSCPIIPKEKVARQCSPRTEHLCFSDSQCGPTKKCCPTSRFGGCSLMCAKPRVLEGCPIPLDFAMIVDKSGSISRRDFKKLLDFIKDMVDGFDLSENGTHVAVIGYSTTAKVEIGFRDFHGPQLNAANFKREVEKIKHPRGLTYIDKALKVAQKLFSETGLGGTRPDVSKVIMVLTDGKQTVDEEGALSSDILYKAVQPLKDENVRVIAVGVGSGTNLFDLLTLASTSNDVFMAENFEQLKGLVTDLTENKCPVHGNWSAWSEWDTCPVTCGGGEQMRWRICNNPSPAHGGNKCPGNGNEIRPCNELPCEVNGNWAEWKAWQKCPVTCGSGTQSRTRSCSNPLPANGGKDCEGESVLTRSCSELPCPVDGKWSDWKAWGLCSVTCGDGKQSRSRACTNPPPQHGGKDCSGENEQVRSCNDAPCPIDGKWSDWKDWGLCSVMCGDGKQSRSRACTSPPPQHGGKDCSGKIEQVRSCNDAPCPIDGRWNDWKSWGICSVTCGDGKQSRSRACTNPPPQHGGKDCSGEIEQIRSCNDFPCPIDGKWTAWKAWGPCSLTCGGGVQKSRRTCTNPEPAFGGADCEGNSERTRLCNENKCPVDGKWSDWKDWGLCSVTCGDGKQSRSRACTNPPPQHGGKDCSGENEQVRSCNDAPCPIDGKWSDWKDWGLCSVTCGDGKQSRSRACTSPPPQHGGKDCSGENEQVRSCNDAPCPIDGKWSNWKDWGLCSVTCGDGKQSRSRACTSPPPQHGGKDCSGENEQVRSCNDAPCPIDGKWSNWKDWGLCSVTCGDGKQSRSRACTSPPPQHGGKDCSGKIEQVRSCNDAPCPIDGRWSDWKSWGICSVTCGDGKQSRSRACTSPPPQHGGKDCSGEIEQVRSCNDAPCPIDGKWSDWKDWGLCSVTCGDGKQSRSRACTSPPPQHGGKDCSGKIEQVRSCNDAPCPIDGKWSDWKDWEICSVTCGDGKQSRSRACTSPPPQHGGKDCSGEIEQVRSCNDAPCPIDGKWSDWKDWDVCSVSCGDGKQSRSRACTNPPPQHGGKDCSGKIEQVRSCNDAPCPIDGRWSDWKDWGLCSVTCGDGKQSRSRACTSPPPQHGGKDCSGEIEQVRSCNDAPCPIDGKWSDWKDWGVCSVSCGDGKQSRSRACTNPPPQHGGKDCSGKIEQVRSCNDAPCPIDGRWSDWKSWGQCSVTCGDGKQSRSRACTSPPPQHGGKDCSGKIEQVRSCNDVPCPIDGKWTAWKAWGPCSVTCGGGVQKSKRTCTNPEPAFGGADCKEDSERSRSCNERGCPVDANWSAWSAFTKCTVSCGGGKKQRSRTCTNPPPKFDGAECIGDSDDIQSCNEFHCPVDGRWSQWGRWGSCSLTCGGGLQDRFRSCDNPSPAFGGSKCSGSDLQTRYCHENPCPVDGKWTAWDNWSTCSLTCGGGTQDRARTCTNPPPEYGGEECQGDTQQFRPCNVNPCPVDGKWTDWGDWNRCSLTCGGGTQGRLRTCTNPPPAYGGAYCTGASRETQPCNKHECPGDGSWSRWKPWGPCSVTCAGGVQSRSRTCTNPPPIHGGKDCKGNGEQKQSCNNQPCPVDGNWTQWRAWRPCPVTCGGARQDRTRSCTNPSPSYGGAKCIGETREIRGCNKIPCPVDGSWARWKPWGTCSLKCGSGTKIRTRDCSYPPPAYGGSDCRGRRRDVRRCNTRPCAVDGNWAAWKAWKPCSRTCGGGTQQRSRTCSNPPPSYGGLKCNGSSSETRTCNEDLPCPVPGGWAQWGRWDACSVTCGSGTQYRSRTCTNPPPSHGGAQCFGQSRQVYYCDRGSCPVDGNWSPWRRWGRCSAKCNGGTKKRSRICSNPPPSSGGKSCPGEAVEVVKCNINRCAVNGNWGRWSRWSSCSKTCGGGGKRTKSRQCNNPPPANGGRACRGRGTSYANCYAPLRCEVNCNVPMDFAILVDTSGSISRKNFKLLKRFIRSIIMGFEISEEHTHIALVEYSTTASVQLKFNDLPGRKNNKYSVIEKVYTIPHRRGTTRIDRALHLANDEVFKSDGGMRDWVKKVALVVTDGEQTRDLKSKRSINEVLTEAVQPLKDKGVRVISLGIGRKVNKESLKTIATGDFVFYASSFNDLRRMVRELKKGTCPISAAGYRYPRYHG